MFLNASEVSTTIDKEDLNIIVDCFVIGVILQHKGKQ